MILRLTCPECKRPFTIELVKAQREIDRLKRELSDLRRMMQEARSINRLFGSFGGMDADTD